MPLDLPDDFGGGGQTGFDLGDNIPGFDEEPSAAEPTFFQRLAGGASSGLGTVGSGLSSILAPIFHSNYYPKRVVDFWTSYLANPSLRAAALHGEAPPAEELALPQADTRLGGVARGVATTALGGALDPTLWAGGYLAKGTGALAEGAQALLKSPVARVATPAVEGAFAAGLGGSAAQLTAQALQEYSQTGSLSPKMVERLTQAGLLSVLGAISANAARKSLPQAAQAAAFAVGPRPGEQLQGAPRPTVTEPPPSGLAFDDGPVGKNLLDQTLDPNPAPEPPPWNLGLEQKVPYEPPVPPSRARLRQVESEKAKVATLLADQLDQAKQLEGTTDPTDLEFLRLGREAVSKAVSDLQRRYPEADITAPRFPDEPSISQMLDQWPGNQGAEVTFGEPADLQTDIPIIDANPPSPLDLVGEVGAPKPRTIESQVAGIDATAPDPYELFGPDYLDILRQSRGFRKPVPQVSARGIPVEAQLLRNAQLPKVWDRATPDEFQGDQFIPQTERGIIEGQILGENPGLEPPPLEFGDQFTPVERIPSPQGRELPPELGGPVAPAPQGVSSGPTRLGFDGPQGPSNLPRPDRPQLPVPGAPEPTPDLTLDTLDYGKPTPQTLQARIRQLFQPISDEHLLQYEGWLRNPDYHPQLAQRAGAVAVDSLVKRGAGDSPTSGDPNDPLPGSADSSLLAKSLLTALNFSREVAGFDFSFPGRQGGLALFSHPRIWAENYVKGLKAGLSALTEPTRQALVERMAADMKADPYYPLAQDLGVIRRGSELRVRHHASEASLLKEDQPSSFFERLARNPEEFPRLGKVPGVRSVVRGVAVLGNASNVANTVFADGLRFGIFKDFAKKLEAAGADPRQLEWSGEGAAKDAIGWQAAYHSIADLSNVLSGVGALSFKKTILGDVYPETQANSLVRKVFGPISALTLFSPRLKAAAIAARNPRYWAKLNEATSPYGVNAGDVVRNAAIAQLALVGAGATALNLLTDGKVTVSLNPEKSDFGKVKFKGEKGDYYYDPTNLASTIRTAYQIATKRKTTASGQQLYLDDPNQIGGQNRIDVGINYLRSQSVPGVGTVLDQFANSTPTGEDPSLVKSGVPLILQDPLDVTASEGVVPGAVFGVGEFNGLNLSHHHPLLESFKRAHNGRDPRDRAELDLWVATMEYRAKALNFKATQARAENERRRAQGLPPLRY